MATINKLFEKRQDIKQVEKHLGLAELNDNEKASLEYIASRDSTTITDIANEDFFNHLSLSTIKRTVNTLQTNKLVKFVSTSDKRERAMVVNPKLEKV